MPFQLEITDDDPLTATLHFAEQSWNIQLASGFWTAADYRTHWRLTSHELLDYWRTKFLILEARPTGSEETCRAFRVSRIGDRFHFHDVLIASPATIGGYQGESLIEWLNRPCTPVLASGRPGHGPPRADVIPEFIVEHGDFEHWHYSQLEPKISEDHRDIDELLTRGDCA